MIIYFVTDIFYHDYESFVKLSVVFCEVHVHHSRPTSCSLVSNFSFISLIFVVDYKLRWLPSTSQLATHVK